ncbi:hypothetical protein [Kingella oralis]
MPYLPDGITQYDTQPNPLDHRRASRVRFAAACLPVLIGVGAVSKILLWLVQPCAEGCSLAFGSRIGGAIMVSVLALFFLLRYQNTWLERRCNDAERGWRVAEWLFNISLGLAAICLRLMPTRQPVAQRQRLSPPRHARAAIWRVGSGDFGGGVARGFVGVNPFPFSGCLRCKA